MRTPTSLGIALLTASAVAASGCGSSGGNNNTTPPSAPTGVQASGGSSEVTVSWSPVTGATSYNIYWSTTSGVTPANGTNAPTRTLDHIAGLVAAGKLRVPIAASFPIEEIRAAVELQAGRHVHGKVVIDL